jgi:hypothetical protein
MAAHQHPSHQPPYRLPGPQEWSRAAPPHDPYRGQPPPPPNYMASHHQPPAPRQRTAIACRYCRRRKVELPPSPSQAIADVSPRFAAPASRPPTTAAAPTACASTRTASSRPSRPRRRPLSPLTPSGAEWATLLPCTVRMGSRFHLRPTGSRTVSRSGSHRICRALQAHQVRPKLIMLMVRLPLRTMRSLARAGRGLTQSLTLPPCRRHSLA